MRKSKWGLDQVWIGSSWVKKNHIGQKVKAKEKLSVLKTCTKLLSLGHNVKAIQNQASPLEANILFESQNGVY